MAVMTPYSFNGTRIDASGAYDASFPADGLAQTPALQTQRLVPVAGGWPASIGPQPGARQFPLRVVLTGSVTDTSVQALKQLFDPALGEVVLQADDGSGTKWQIRCSVVAISSEAKAFKAWKITLQATDGRWTLVTAQTVTSTITATTKAISLTTGGNQRTPLKIAATPTVVKGTGSDYRYRSQVVLAHRATRAAVQYPTMLLFDAATEIGAGRMQAVASSEINDLRVLVDAVEVDRWLGDTGVPAALEIWINLDCSPARSAVITTAMTNVSPATGASITTTDPTGFSTLPDTGVILVGTEAIAYTSKSADNLTLQSITRAVRNTTAASHSAGTPGSSTPNAYWIEHQIDVIWGSSTATAPTTNDSRKPLVNVGPSSNNTTWAFTNFADAQQLRQPQFTTDLEYTNAQVVCVRGAEANTNVYGTADGSDAGGSAVGTANKWQCVNDAIGASDNDATYVSFAGSGKYSTTATPTQPPAGSLLELSVVSRVRANAPTTGSYRVYLKISGTRYYGTGGFYGLNGSYFTNTDTWDTNPATTAPWAAADVATLEWGVDVVIGDAALIRVTQLVAVGSIAADADPATALGIYVAPASTTTGHPNRDTWLCGIPTGVTGSGCVVAALAGGPNVEPYSAQILGIDQDGNTKILGAWAGAASGSTTLTCSADSPLYQVGIRLYGFDTSTPPVAAAQLLTGFALTALTLTLDSTQVPSATQGAREDMYLHRWTLTSSTISPTEAITVLWPSALSKKLTIDADAGTVTYELAGYSPLPCLTLDAARLPWLEAGVGANTLNWADATQGTGSLTFVVTSADRRN